MLDIKLVQNDPDLVRKKMASRGIKVDLSAFLKLNEKKKAFLQKIETRRSELNKTSKLIGQMKKESKDASNLIKEMNDNNQNCSSILLIQDFLKNQMTRNLREMIIGGACSLFLNKGVKPLLQTNENSVWSEVYNNTSEKWNKDNEKQQTIAAFTEFGQGKVVAIGDIDIFTSNSRIGLNSYDNRKFIQNIINWMITPVKESKVMTFISIDLVISNMKLGKITKF